MDGHKLWKEYRQEEMPEQNSREAGEKGGGTRQTETNRSLRFLRNGPESGRNTLCGWKSSISAQGLPPEEDGSLCVSQEKAGMITEIFWSSLMVSGEEVELDLDSFDYITYWYSREHYEGVVLLEPLDIRKFTACGKW